jgi:hypothetical protein
MAVRGSQTRATEDAPAGSGRHQSSQHRDEIEWTCTKLLWLDVVNGLQ